MCTQLPETAVNSCQRQQSTIVLHDHSLHTAPTCPVPCFHRGSCCQPSAASCSRVWRATRRALPWARHPTRARPVRGYVGRSAPAVQRDAQNRYKTMSEPIDKKRWQQQQRRQYRVPVLIKQNVQQCSNCRKYHARTMVMRCSFFLSGVAVLWLAISWS